jgi:hypothetical protein
LKTVSTFRASQPIDQPDIGLFEEKLHGIPVDDVYHPY